MSSPPMSAAPPDPAAITAAVRSLAALERLDWNPGARPPGTDAADAAPAAVLLAAGPAVFAEIAAALPTATGTGRVALAQLALSLDRERGAQLIAQLRDDPTPARVDTCLVGFRSVAQWARTHAPPAGTRVPPLATSPRRLLWLVLAALVGLGVAALALSR